MKSKRRHELQENVLAVEIGRIIEFLRRYGNHIATGVLVLAVIALGLVWLRNRARSQEARLDRRWRDARSQTLQPPQRVKLLTELAEQEDDKRIAALACVELGDEFARRLFAATRGPERLALGEKAEVWYRSAAVGFPDEHLAVAKALYGLGKLSETARNWKQADKFYNQVLLMTRLSGQPVVQLARSALGGLKRLQQPVRMATTAPTTRPERPETRPATRPTTRPATRPTGSGVP